MAVTDTFNRTMEILRNVPVSDGGGGWTRDLVSQATDVPCRLSPLTWAERLSALQLAANVSHRLYTGAAVDIQRQDVARIDAVDYEVQAVRVPSVTSSHLEVDVRQKQAGV